jgi:hypothetical protein
MSISSVGLSRDDRRSSPGRLLVSVNEALEILSIGRTKFYALVAAREIALVKVAAASRVPVASLEQYVERLIAAQADGAARPAAPAGDAPAASEVAAHPLNCSLGRSCASAFGPGGKSSRANVG